MPLGFWPSLLVLAVAIVILLWGRQRERRYTPGRPGFVSPYVIQLIAGIVILVVAAHLVSLVTGLSWAPPRGRF